MAKNDARTLYHFTSRQALPKIFAVGLKAKPFSDWPEEVIGRMKGVWLTTNAQMPPIFSSYADFRIKLAIPRSDKRLVHWRTWTRERLTSSHVAGLDADQGGEWRSFYLYLGNIVASRIQTADEYLDLASIEAYRSDHVSRSAQRGDG
jgi:hypothetical protein